MVDRRPSFKFFVIGISKKTGQIVRFSTTTRREAVSGARGLKNVKIFTRGTPRAIAKRNRPFFKVPTKSLRRRLLRS